MNNSFFRKKSFKILLIPLLLIAASSCSFNTNQPQNESENEILSVESVSSFEQPSSIEQTSSFEQLSSIENSESSLVEEEEKEQTEKESKDEETSVDETSSSMEESDDTPEEVEPPQKELTEQEKWQLELDEKILLIDEYCTSLEEKDMYCFFTDPHLYDGGGYGASGMIMHDWMKFLKDAYNSSNSDFIMCGGDLLNNSDSKQEACYKLSSFDYMMRSSCHDYHYIVGNHDTNYQGDTYISNFDFQSCMLSQNTINELLFDGGKSYYSFSIETTSYYCFDSGIDWLNDSYSSYEKEQVEWFANSLLADNMPHKAIFIHIALNDKKELTALTSKIDRIIKGFNKKELIDVDGSNYDYSSAQGKIEFIQSGHFHIDLDNYLCGDVPIIFTRSFSSPEIATKPTFDFVVANYTDSIIKCFRIGDGEDRTFNLTN